MISEQELKLLEIFVKKHVLNKLEIKSILNENGGSVISSLLEKGLITKVSLLGETTYAITQKGRKYFEEITQ
ncbi:MAG TPA: hypothetical protein EYH56_03555 [Nanoarchaeota archaeon]|nr:hypothetical protein [Nanoarchaeota archaeon]